MSWKTLPITQAVLDNCKSQLESRPNIFKFSQEPSLAPLLACLGIQYELGQPGMDRLTPLLVENEDTVEMSCEIGLLENQFAIKVYREDRKPLKVSNRFNEIIHPMSFAASGEVIEFVIVPNHIAATMELKGLELVIVKPWVTSTFLEKDNPINYVTANVWEINNNTTQYQVEFLNHKQLPFSGIHDLVDHIVDCDLEGLTSSQYLQKLNRFFTQKKDQAWSNYELMHSYLIGALLDDLAQPPLYRSAKHNYLLGKAFEKMDQEKKSARPNAQPLKVFPESLNKLMHFLREQDEDFFTYVDLVFDEFDAEAKSLSA